MPGCIYHLLYFFFSVLFCFSVFFCCFFYYIYNILLQCLITHVCFSLHGFVIVSRPIWGMCVHSFLCQQFCLPFSENECEATVPLKKQQRQTYDLQHNAFCTVCKKLCACLLHSSSLDWGYTQYIPFVLLSANMILCEWQSRCIFDSKGCTVLCAVSCTKECQCSNALLMPTFIYHAIPFSNIYLLHVVYHLIYSIPLSVSFRIK